MIDNFQKIDIKLGNREIKVDLKKELEIDTSSPEVIANQLESIPATLSYWYGVVEYATVIDAKVKELFDEWWSHVYTEVKDDLINKYGKTATTESSIKNEIIVRYPKEYKEWIKALTTAQYQKNRLKSIPKCFEIKQESLINLLSYYKRLADNG